MWTSCTIKADFIIITHKYAIVQTSCFIMKFPPLSMTGAEGLMTLTFPSTSPSPRPLSAPQKFYTESAEIAIPLRVILNPVFHTCMIMADFIIIHNYVIVWTSCCIKADFITITHNYVIVWTSCFIMVLNDEAPIASSLTCSSLGLQVHCTRTNSRTPAPRVCYGRHFNGPSNRCQT